MFEKTSYRSSEDASIRGLYIFIWDTPGLDIRPVCYCAGYKEEGEASGTGGQHQYGRLYFTDFGFGSAYLDPVYLLGELEEKPEEAGRKICYNYSEKKKVKKCDGQEADLRELYPAHYTCFHCIASSCDFSCCREWKIYADDITFRKWQKKGIRKVTRRVNGQRVVRLTEDLNCPHLAEDGLCRIITEYGEGLIPWTCRAFQAREQFIDEE